MPYCPNCDNRITELNEYTKGEEKHRFYVGTNEEIETEYLDWIDGGGNNVEYECPNCKEVLFEYYNEAEAFLKECICDSCRAKIKENVIKETIKEHQYYFCSVDCRDNYKMNLVAVEL